jgi:hypothetical protein
MERERIPRIEQAIEGILITLSGGVIGVIGALAEGKILLENDLNVNAAFSAGGVTLIGAISVISGAVILENAIRNLKKDRE